MQLHKQSVHRGACPTYAAKVQTKCNVQCKVQYECVRHQSFFLCGMSPSTGQTKQTTISQNNNVHNTRDAGMPVLTKHIVVAPYTQRGDVISIGQSSRRRRLDERIAGISPLALTRATRLHSLLALTRTAPRRTSRIEWLPHTCERTHV